MERDEQLAHALQRKEIDHTLRVYGWKPAAISIGMNQNIEEFDLERVIAEHLDIVRRPTGGRAILHSQELTYSVVMRAAEIGPREIYRIISNALIRGLRKLGIEAELSGEDAFPDKRMRAPESIPCFSGSAKYEIQYHGKKLVGSAQRRYGDVVLQHGSLLLGDDHLRILDFIKPDSGNIDLVSRTIDAGTILGRAVSFEETAQALRRGFEESLSITFS